MLEQPAISLNSLDNSKASRIIFYSCLIWLSGFFFFPTGQLHNQAFILLIVVPALWIIVTKRTHFQEFFKSKLFGLVMIFCVYYLASTMWANIDDISSHLSLIKRVIYLYAFWLIIFYTFYLEDEKIKTLNKIIIISALIGFCIHLIYFLYFTHNPFTERFYGFGRLRNALWVAALFGAMAISALTISLHASVKHKFVYYLLFGIFFVATLITHSRGPILSLIAVSYFVVLISKISRKSKAIVLVLSCLALISPFLLQANFLQSDISRGQSYRLDLWMGFINQTKNTMLFGRGAGENVSIFSPGTLVDGWSHYHNVYLGSFVELGLIGLTLHILLIGYTIFTGLRYRENLPTNVATMVFIFSAFIGISYGQGVITRLNAQWIVFWLPLTFIILRDLENLQVEKVILFKKLS